MPLDEAELLAARAAAAERAAEEHLRAAGLREGGRTGAASPEAEAPALSLHPSVAPPYVPDASMRKPISPPATLRPLRVPPRA